MIVLTLLLAAAAAPSISSEPIGQSRFRLRMSNVVHDIEAAQAALTPTARKLCGTRPIVFEAFRISIEGIAQELFCGSAQTGIERSSSRAGWQPSPGDQQSVLAATYAYFMAKDRGRFATAWSMLSEGMKEMSPAPEWARGARDFDSRAGPVQARRITEITWYDNPPDAPEPGLYVAADFSAAFQNLDFVCGYVMWRVRPDGSLVLTREEQNIFDKARAKSLAAIDRAPLRAEMGCKD